MTSVIEAKRMVDRHGKGSIKVNCSEETLCRYGGFSAFLLNCGPHLDAIELRDDGMVVTRGGKTAKVPLPKTIESDKGTEFDRYKMAYVDVHDWFSRS